MKTAVWSVWSFIFLHFHGGNAGETLEVSEALLELFNKPNFAVKGLSFPLAVELFAVLKSIIAVAAGECHEIPNERC